MFRINSSARKSDPAAAHIRADLERAHADLTCAYARFNSITDPALIESCIYEIRAIESRYGYLLRSAKDCAVAPAVQTEEIWT